MVLVLKNIVSELNIPQYDRGVNLSNQLSLGESHIFEVPVKVRQGFKVLKAKVS